MILTCGQYFPKEKTWPDMRNVNECRMALVKNLIKENFYGKRKKKTINVLTVFFISHKSDVKIFLKLILNQCHLAIVNMTWFLNEAEFDKNGISKITLKLVVFYYRLHSSKSSCISLSPVKAIISEIVLHPNQIWCRTYHL